MKPLKRIALAAITFVAVASLSADPADSERIFNGRILDGWQSDAAVWRVEEGALTAEIPQGQELAHNCFTASPNGPEATPFRHPE